MLTCACILKLETYHLRNENQRSTELIEFAIHSFLNEYDLYEYRGSESLKIRNNL